MMDGGKVYPHPDSLPVAPLPPHESPRTRRLNITVLAPRVVSFTGFFMLLLLQSSSSLRCNKFSAGRGSRSPPEIGWRIRTQLSIFPCQINSWKALMD